MDNQKTKIYSPTRYVPIAKSETEKPEFVMVYVKFFNSKYQGTKIEDNTNPILQALWNCLCCCCDDCNICNGRNIDIAIPKNSTKTQMEDIIAKKIAEKFSSALCTIIAKNMIIKNALGSDIPTNFILDKSTTLLAWKE